MGYLDYTGLAYFWQKCKAKFASKTHAHSAATSGAAGFMSAADKQKLDSLSAGGGTGGSSGGLPTFTYTGNHQLIDDGIVDGVQNWRIKFLTSGTLRFLSLDDAACQLFLVGGGGGARFGGGGGGYTGTFAVAPVVGTDYPIVIGAGGAGAEGAAVGGRGGTTTALGCSAEGGYGANQMVAGNGGSSGGGYMTGAGGSDGGNGGGSLVVNWGTGQGSTTREFGDSDGDLYGGGGGGSPSTNYTNSWPGPNGIPETAAGGAGGGGTGAVSMYSTAGATNTGGGGGGQFKPGGSGIAILRNVRAVSA